MTLSCDCGQFKASLKSFPGNTPGRLVCYCRDCQHYLERLGRTELLDDWGGTEVIPTYPADIVIDQGIEQLKCYRLREKGLDRWVASCCNTPMFNIRPAFPWAGIPRSAYTNAAPDALASLGEVRSRINGNAARPGAPFAISENLALKDALVVAPFILKGKLLGRHKGSPLYAADDRTPIVAVELLEA